MYFLLKIYILFCCYITLKYCQTDELPRMAEDIAKEYLLRYGYLDYYMINDVILRDGLKRLQHYANLNQTGDLDSSTRDLMMLPRCGLEDIDFLATNGYKREPMVWKKNLLTWSLDGRGRTLDRETIRSTFKKALKYWSTVIDINFKEVTNKQPDINVKFATSGHGDQYSFDCKGGTVAHAFYPRDNDSLSGDIHFDDAEEYTVQSTRGISLLWTSIHQIGHSLGLNHSNVRDAVMYPWPQMNRTDFKLNNDDIERIQALYGSKVKPTAFTTSTLSDSIETTSGLSIGSFILPDKRPCPASSLSTVYYSPYARLTVILTEKNKIYFVKQNGGIRYGPISRYNYLPKVYIPEMIGAAFTTDILDGKDRTVFFAGTKSEFILFVMDKAICKNENKIQRYYIYHHFRYQSGPHSIHGNIPGDKNPLNLTFPASVRNIDAVITWQHNKRIYFFTGLYYWRYDNTSRQLEAGYPLKTQTIWKGLPKRIDAAYSSETDKRTFFVSGNQYYLLDDQFAHVEHSYPEHIGRKWLNCGGRSSMTSTVLIKSVHKEEKERPEP